MTECTTFWQQYSLPACKSLLLQTDWPESYSQGLKQTHLVGKEHVINNVIINDRGLIHQGGDFPPRPSLLNPLEQEDEAIDRTGGDGTRVKEIRKLSTYIWVYTLVGLGYIYTVGCIYSEAFREFDSGLMTIALYLGHLLCRSYISSTWTPFTPTLQNTHAKYTKGYSNYMVLTLIQYRFTLLANLSNQLTKILHQERE